MVDALRGQYWLFWRMEQLHKVFMFNIWLIFGAHMVTDKQFALKISWSYKPKAEIDKWSRELDRRSEGFIYPAVIATHRLKLYHITPNSHIAESSSQGSVRDAQLRICQLVDTYALIILHTGAVRAWSRLLKAGSVHLPELQTLQNKHPWSQKLRGSCFLVTKQFSVKEKK